MKDEELNRLDEESDLNIVDDSELAQRERDIVELNAEIVELKEYIKILKGIKSTIIKYQNEIAELREEMQSVASELEDWLGKQIIHIDNHRYLENNIIKRLRE